MYKENNIFKKFSCFLTILIVFLFSTNCYGAVDILNVRHWTAPDHTRIVLDVDDEPDYEFKESQNLLILNFNGATVSESIPDKIVINKPGIKNLVFHQLDEDTVKIEFILDKYQKIEVFKLKKFQDKPNRVVVDIFLEQVSKEEEKTTALISEPRKKKIIVIDPGHGGEDPGAVGKRRTYEKNVVLSIGREIKKAINKIPGYRAVLTRDGDYYVSFRKRLQKAKAFGASLFISVHADAARNRSAKGSSVYCLSTGAASNEAAKLLAKNENLSDILGGVPESEGNNESSQIIMNMFQTNTMNVSKIYAGILMKHLDRVSCLKHKSVQEAPFRVLKLPDIPAVLIETAYISNLQEESLLKKSGFQKNLAISITSSIEEYLSGTAVAPQSEVASQKDDDTVKANKKQNDDEITTTYYKIKRGDTLFSVAGHFNTKVAVLLKLNNLKLEDPLFAGRKIVVPVNKTGNEEKIRVVTSEQKDKSKVPPKASRIYTVQKGDTLFRVAKNNSITIPELLKLNNMRSTDPLLYGQKIKLP
jgi:N-acetylmuramoyl-L-alanine amidase